MYERIIQEMGISGIKTISDLERKAEVSLGTIRNIRYGHTPKPDSLVRIANVLGVSANYLLTGEPDDDPFDNPTPPEVYMKQRQVLSLLDGLSPENYQAAIDYLTYLKAKGDAK